MRGLFKLSSNQGNADALFNLAVMEANGEGGDQDMAHAYVLFIQAYHQGLDKAKAAAEEIEPKLSDADRARADQMLNGVGQ